MKLRWEDHPENAWRWMLLDMSNGNMPVGTVHLELDNTYTASYWPSKTNDDLEDLGTFDTLDEAKAVVMAVCTLGEGS